MYCVHTQSKNQHNRITCLEELCSDCGLGPARCHFSISIKVFLELTGCRRVYGWFGQSHEYFYTDVKYGRTTALPSSPLGSLQFARSSEPLPHFGLWDSRAPQGFQRHPIKISPKAVAPWSQFLRHGHASIFFGGPPLICGGFPGDLGSFLIVAVGLPSVLGSLPSDLASLPNPLSLYRGSCLRSCVFLYHDTNNNYNIQN